LYESFWYLNKQTNKTDMKTKLLAVMATLGMVASASAVKVNNNLSINGFIDGSYSNSDSNDASAGTSSETSNTGIDEVELNFLVNAGNVSGELHLDSSDSDDLDIEQVHFTYSFDNGVSVQLGQFGLALGFEREDPAGLYTFSRAYDAEFDLGNVDGSYLGEGVRLAYNAGDFSFSLGLLNGVGATEEDANNEDDYDTEVVIGYTGIDNLTLNAGVITVNNNDVKGPPAVDGGSTDIYSVNAAYTLNKLLLGGEYTSIEADGSQDRSGYLLLANYSINSKLGVTVRYSEWESMDSAAGTGGADKVEDRDKLSFAPSYAITDSLGAILEFSTEEISGGDEAGDEVDSIALELTYTF